jgi:hypothetical protein
LKTSKELTGPAKAREARAEYAAERALNDPLKLKMAARIFRAARARGLMDAEGNVLEDIEQAEAS